MPQQSTTPVTQLSTHELDRIAGGVTSADISNFFRALSGAMKSNADISRQILQNLR